MFDPAQLENPDYQEHFNLFHERMQEVERSIVAGYGLPVGVDKIHSYIASDFEFNAQAGQVESTLMVSLNAPVLISLRVLFDLLLEKDHILPALLQPSESKITYRTQTFLKAYNPGELSLHEISISKERYKASSTLSDLCSTFMMLHEFGHVICGHPGALATKFSEASLVEFNSFAEGPKVNSELRRYWEFQADNIAAALLAQYVDDAVSRAEQFNPWLRTCLDQEVVTFEQQATHFSAMVIASLHVLFLYSDSCQFEVPKFSYHPPAQTRLMYVKDVFAGEIASRLRLDADEIVDVYFSTYLSQFLSGLEELGLEAHKGFDDTHLDDVERLRDELVFASNKYRSVCEKWSLVPTNQWANPR